MSDFVFSIFQIVISYLIDLYLIFHIFQQKWFWLIPFLTFTTLLWLYTIETWQPQFINSKRDVVNLFASVLEHRIFLRNFPFRVYRVQRKISLFLISLFHFIIRICYVDQCERQNRVPLKMLQHYLLLES